MFPPRGPVPQRAPPGKTNQLFPVAIDQAAGDSPPKLTSASKIVNWEDSGARRFSVTKTESCVANQLLCVDMKEAISSLDRLSVGVVVNVFIFPVLERVSVDAVVCFDQQYGVDAPVLERFSTAIFSFC